MGRVSNRRAASRLARLFYWRSGSRNATSESLDLFEASQIFMYRPYHVYAYQTLFIVHPFQFQWYKNDEVRKYSQSAGLHWLRKSQNAMLDNVKSKNEDQSKFYVGQSSKHWPLCTLQCHKMWTSKAFCVCGQGKVAEKQAKTCHTKACLPSHSSPFFNFLELRVFTLYLREAPAFTAAYLSELWWPTIKCNRHLHARMCAGVRDTCVHL